MIEMALIHERLTGRVRLTILIVLLVQLVPQGALAQDGTAGQARQPSLEEIKRVRIVYRVPGMEQAEVQKNLTYKTIGGLRLQADAYSPRTLRRDERRPAIIFVPGDGPWEVIKDIKDWGVNVSYGQLAAASGFVGITFNHRSTEQLAKLRDVAGDVDELVAYVRRHADSLHVDRERICVWVFSAGGSFLRTILNEKPSYVRCVVAYYSLLGISAGAASDEVVREFTLADHLGRNPQQLAPMLLVRAGRDAPFINTTIDEFLREAVRQNIDIEFINYVDGRHAFDMLDDKERSREIIERTLAFVKRHLAPK